jgi:hypothetical protein
MDRDELKGTVVGAEVGRVSLVCGYGVFAATVRQISSRILFWFGVCERLRRRVGGVQGVNRC